MISALKMVSQHHQMQRLIALRVRDKHQVGNWSGTGAGKTLSAVLASRVIRAGMTIVCCPNNVVGEVKEKGWKSEIENISPDSLVCTKTFHPNWAAAVGDETGLRHCGRRFIHPLLATTTSPAYNPT